MQSEEFDKKIQQAAEHHHPAYDEKAWTKMEKLLDRDLPQKKDDRRRIIFFLLLFLLLGGAATFLFINKPGHKESLASEGSQLQQTNSANTTVAAKNKQTIPPVIPGKKNEAANEKELLQSSPTGKPIQLNRTQHGDPLQVAFNKRKVQVDKLSSVVKNEQPAGAVKPVLVTNNAAGNDIVKNNPSATDPATKNNNSGNTLPLHTIAEKDIPIKNQQEQAVVITSQKDDKNKNGSPAIVSPVVKNNKSRNKKTNSFFFSLSTAPDISAAGTSKSGTMKLTAGGGLGYTFHDRLTLRTGFYSGRKVYSAEPDQYHPPKAAWTNYVDLKKIDADCRVYEIPLLVSYNFSHSSKESWLATVGLSSYLMKRETYSYLYKDQWGQYQYSSGWTIYDANKHYFSVLTLSAGYQRNLNNTFFIAAEPYLKVPVHGVGYGKVHLNSAGIQFTLGIRPFGAAKKPGPPQHE